MTLTIEIPVETEKRLEAEAARLGLDTSQCARRLIEKGLPADTPSIDQSTLDLLAQWDEEDQTDDLDEIARRQQEFEELKAALNQNRIDAGGPGARKVFP